MIDEWEVDGGEIRRIEGWIKEEFVDESGEFGTICWPRMFGFEPFVFSVLIEDA